MMKDDVRPDYKKERRERSEDEARSTIIWDKDGNILYNGRSLTPPPPRKRR